MRKAPPQTPEQRKANLAIANDVRIRRANLKKELKAGRAGVIDLLLDPPDYLKTMKIAELLRAVPRWGEKRVNRLLVLSRISPSRSLEALSDRQRKDIVDRMKKASRKPIA